MKTHLTLAALSLLLLAATSSQLPRKAAQHHSPSPKHDSTHTQHKQTPTQSPTPTVVEIKATPGQRAADQVTSHDESEAKPIRVVPVDVHLNRVDIHKDWLDVSFVGFSALLAIVGVLQVYLVIRLFAVTHRPKVHVRSVQVQSFNTVDFINVSFTVVNLGGTRARVLDSQWNLTLDRNAIVPTSRPPLPPYGDRRQPMQRLPKTLRPGESYEIREAWRSSEMLMGTADMEGQRWRILTSEYHAGSATLYVLGYIKYRDRLGLIHKTSFCRRYVPTPPRGGFLEPVENSDYEYQE